MPMQLSIIRRGDTLDPMVVDVSIDMTDIKGIKTQLHLGSDDSRRGKHIIPIQQIVELNAMIAVDQCRFSRRTGKGQHPKHIIIANTSMFSWPTQIQSLLPCLARALPQRRVLFLIIDLVGPLTQEAVQVRQLPQRLVLGVDGFGHLSSRFAGLGVSKQIEDKLGIGSSKQALNDRTIARFGPRSEEHTSELQ